MVSFPKSTTKSLREKAMRMADIKLVQIVIEAIYRCNAACIFCYNCWKQDYDQRPELGIKEWKRVVDGLPEVKWFTISGGEPLLRKDLPDLIDLLQEKSKGVSVLTNGLLLDNLWAREFKERNVFVQVPLHGLQRIHDELVGVKGGYNRAIKGIAYLKKHDVDFAVSVVGNRKNINEIGKVFELGVALGASELLAIRFLPGGEGLKNQELMLTADEYRKFLSEFDRVLHHYRINGKMGVPNLPCKFPENDLKALCMTGCTAGIDWLALDPSGRVRFCNHSPTILGDLRTQNFEDIWNGPFLKSIRAGKMVPDECNGCEKVQECRGGCRAVAETLFNDWKAPDPLFNL
jgi:radical SAM protein with 4Fe4S-binding SPASM domain